MSNSALLSEAMTNNMSNSMPLSEATYEQLSAKITERLQLDSQKVESRLREVEAAEKALEERQLLLEEMERRILAVSDNLDDIIELNVGGQCMSTTRSVLCTAEGSLLAGMFSGNFDEGHKRDKDGRVFLDVDPPLFAKILSHLRLSRLSSPDCPAPLPFVPEELRPEYDLLVRYFGLEAFMYGNVGTGNIFQRIAELSNVSQSKLQTSELVRVMLGTTGGVPATNHEEVISPSGFHERSLENSYGAHPSTITIRFLKHRVRVEGMELRAKLADIGAHMSNSWEFRHGSESLRMNFVFSRQSPSTGRLDCQGFGPAFVDEVSWRFPRDFCLEHIVLYGRVMVK